MLQWIHLSLQPCLGRGLGGLREDIDLFAGSLRWGGVEVSRFGGSHTSTCVEQVKDPKDGSGEGETKTTKDGSGA